MGRRCRPRIRLWLLLAVIGCRPSLEVPPPTKAAPAGAVVTSVRTALEAPPCVPLPSRETEEATRRCPGVGGYALLVHDADARMSVTVLDRDGRQHPLDYWSVITRSFSHLAEQAEWRLRDGVPVALIVPVFASESPDAEVRYLAVARLAPAPVCVTDRIPGGAKGDEVAREAADRSAGRPCAGEVE
jgi:hypothetical protein